MHSVYLWLIIATFVGYSVCYKKIRPLKTSGLNLSQFRVHGTTAQHRSPVYLERMVERKKIEVDSILRKHQAADDPLVMRMGYMASECRY
jgi:hypothetical protein